MLEINDLNIEVNQKIIIAGLNLVLNKGDKLAIIGEEGNGKSTLLKAICGMCDYANITGTINDRGNKIGYLEQSISNNDLDKSVYSYLFISDEDFYNKINDYYKYVIELELDDSFLERDKVKYLSGGEKIKLQLLRLLLEDADILLLDEPTNDLDMDTLFWLERFINSSRKPIMYVSHDETLLSNTANMILHLELINKKSISKYNLEKIDYDSYVEKRLNYIQKTTQVSNKEKEQYNKQQNKLNRVMQKVHHQLNTISRSDPHGAKLLKKKMKTMKSQEKRFDKMELTEKPDVEEAINFFFEVDSLPVKKEIINISIDKLIVGKNILANDIKLSVLGGDHIVIVGKNGCGKTSLLNIIYEELKQRQDISVGYMPQNYDSILVNYDTALDFLCDKTADKDIISRARSLMGSMKFTSEEMIGKLSNLSGGSKAKLFIIKLIFDNNNVLILDEPTRNVSPLSNPVIRNELSKFKGVIISVSHDRKYIVEVCNLLYKMDENGLELVK